MHIFVYSSLDYNMKWSMSHHYVHKSNMCHIAKSQMWIVLTTQKSVFWFEFLSFYLNERRTNKGYNCQDLKKNMEHQTNFVICLLNSFFVTRKAENKNKWNFNYFGSDYFSFTESSHLQYLVSIVRRKISEWFYIEDKLSLVLFFLFTTYANGFYSVKWNIATSWTQWL